MELKRYIKRNSEVGFTLLIVPYGIETAKAAQDITLSRVLLIVPYGIETTFLANNPTGIDYF